MQRRGLQCLQRLRLFSSFCGCSGWSVSTTIGGLIHVLLVVAIVIVLLRVIQGRRVFGT